MESRVPGQIPFEQEFIDESKGIKDGTVLTLLAKTSPTQRPISFTVHQWDNGEVQLLINDGADRQNVGMHKPIDVKKDVSAQLQSGMPSYIIPITTLLELIREGTFVRKGGVKTINRPHPNFSPPPPRTIGDERTAPRVVKTEPSKRNRSAERMRAAQRIKDAQNAVRDAAARTLTSPEPPRTTANVVTDLETLLAKRGDTIDIPTLTRHITALEARRSSELTPFKDRLNIACTTLEANNKASTGIRAGVFSEPSSRLALVLHRI